MKAARMFWSLCEKHGLGFIVFQGQDMAVVKGKSVGRYLVEEKLSCMNKAQETALREVGGGRVSLRKRCGEGTAGLMYKGHTTLS